jgi:hypothetical protein
MHSVDSVLLGNPEEYPIVHYSIYCVEHKIYTVSYILIIHCGLAPCL